MHTYLTLYSATARPLLICFVGIGALFGMLAVLSPRAASLLNAKGNHWVDTRRLLCIPENKLFRTFDRWVDTDQFTLRYARLTGVLILVESAILGYLCLVR